MNKLETRRVNPIARITVFIVALLIVFEVLIICGAMGLKTNTVAKYTPWAYESFLKLVGEHPESTPRRASIEETKESSAELSEINVTGLAPSSIPLLVEAHEAQPVTNTILEATLPIATEINSDVLSTNTPVATPLEILPVG